MRVKTAPELQEEPLSASSQGGVMMNETAWIRNPRVELQRHCLNDTRLSPASK
jgi:hypothetical protein